MQADPYFLSLSATLFLGHMSTSSDSCLNITAFTVETPQGASESAC